MKKTVPVVVIIVNWNGEDILRRCLTSLLENTRSPDFAVTVVDNGSDDGSVAMLRSRFPSVELIALDRNHGFAFANNIAIKASLEKHDPRHVLLLNNDTVIIQQDWLKLLVDAAEENADAGIVGCTLKTPEGKEDHCGLRFFQGISYHVSPVQPKPLERVAIVMGACFLIKRAVIDSIGLFDPAFSPVYAEESDYCFRAMKAGFSVYCATGSSVVHHGGQSTRRWEGEGSEYLHYVSKRNFLRFRLLNFPLPWLVINGLSRTPLRMLELLRVFIVRRDTAYSYSLFNLKIRDNYRAVLGYFIHSYTDVFADLKEIIEKRFHRRRKLWYP